MCRSAPKRRCAAGARPRIWHRARSCFESQLHICGRQKVSSETVTERLENRLASGISSGRTTETETPSDQALDREYPSFSRTLRIQNRNQLALFHANYLRYFGGEDEVVGGS